MSIFTSQKWSSCKWWIVIWQNELFLTRLSGLTSIKTYMVVRLSNKKAISEPKITFFGLFRPEMTLLYHLQSSASGHKRHNFLDGFLSKYHMRHFLKHFDCRKVLIQYPGDWLEDPGFTNIFVPGYLGIMVTRQQQFCCIFAATKDKFYYFLKKFFSLWYFA